MRGLTATAVADMWKSLVLLICCQRPVDKGLVVTAPTNDCSEHHGVPVPCYLPEEEDEVVSVQRSWESFAYRHRGIGLVEFLARCLVGAGSPVFAFCARRVHPNAIRRS